MQKNSKFYNIIKEPLLHFLLIGAALFLIYSNTNETTQELDEDQITVTKNDVKQLAQKFEDAKGRQPNENEKKEILNNFIQEEVLYREALKKGLDKEDATIHLHLAKKMQFILDDLHPIKKPTQAQLESFLQNNKDKFMKEAKISFNQVTFTDDKNKNDIQKSAEKFLSKLLTKTNPKVAFIGDLVELNKKEISKVFGQEFSDKIFTMKMKQWAGPLAAKHGLVLVYIHSIKDAYLPELKDIKEDVELEYIKVEQAKANQVFYKELQKNYKIVVQ